MRKQSSTWLAVLILAASFISCADEDSASAAEPATESFSAEDLEFFEKQVRPLLVERCHKCHGSKKQEGKLRLDSRNGVLRGGETGPAVMPGKPDESLLVDAINYGELYQMPPKSKLAPAEIAILTRWVKRGAPWSPEAVTSGPVEKTFDLHARRRAHWSWQPIRPRPTPQVVRKDWPRAAVDHFILAKLEAQKLTPAEPAARHTLIRRAYFDLIGLPPTPEEVAAFESDRSEQAFARVVDRLLESPHFGERWARHWLDLVRYAESRGHEFDANVPNAYQYRDYVIRALNADVPYDRFVVEHIAGDLVPSPRLHPRKKFNESVLGTGFWFLGEWVHSPVSIRKDETDRFDNMLDVMTKTFLGLTVACARCHDHKFDAISQRDYYALAGYLQSSNYRQVRFESIEHNRRIAGEIDKLRTDHTPAIRRAVGEATAQGAASLSKYLISARDALRSLPAAEQAATDDVVLDKSTNSGPSKTNSTPGKLTKAQRDHVAALAGEHKLDAALLTAWVEHLRTANGNPRDLFHLWAKLSAEPSPVKPARLVQCVEAALPKRTPAAPKPDDMRVIVDYASAGPEAWMTDGFVFGTGPVRAGDVRLTGDPQRPIDRVFSFAAARRDPVFDGLNLAPGTLRDEGRTNKWNTPGHVIRTRSFTLGNGTLYYLVQGAGKAYVGVDSHRLIRGPLHGRIVKEWDDDGTGKPRWIAHDVRRYQGHRAHIEIVGPESGEMALLRIVEAQQPPPVVDVSENLLRDALAASPPESVNELAERYQRLVETTGRLLANGKLATAEGAKHAELANWMVNNPQLFIRAGSREQQRIELSSAAFAAAYAPLAAQIEQTSRTAMAMMDGSAENEFLLVRGNYKNPADPVPRRFLEALGGQGPAPGERGSGRLALARQIVSPENPFTARVMVNRVWHHLFGRGIVASVDNFGVLGQRPTHPELLDALADEFVREGWSLKKLIRSIMLSSAYQMSSMADPRALAEDPQNLLLQHMRLRRLEGEAIRDAVLAISGRLDRQTLGPSVPVYLTPFMAGRGRPAGGPLDGKGRRSLYIAVRRNFLSPMMLAFDAPIPFNTMGRRNMSNVPAQALILMNDPLIVEQAKLWAARLLARPQLSPAQRVTRMYREAVARPPERAELAAALEFIGVQAETLGIKPEQAATDARVWADLCHVMMNVKDFVFLN